MAYSADSFSAGEQPTTSKWNKLWSNDASFNDGTGIGTNAIQGASLSTSAILLGFATVTSNFNTSSTTSVQITGMTKTVTVPAGGRSVKITAQLGAIYNSTVNDGYELIIWDGTVGSGTQLNSMLYEAISPANVQGISCVAIHTPSAGSKTYNCSIRAVGGGTINTQSNSTAPGLLIVELI